ncbi:ribosome hibernation-promoting factor, HPF/YfiA family [Bacillus fonticola]|uniref:ribosome hibernation-promoting factor, HPF/YfiA family n=1 Tax=Bacillus fonticola TaxID=2728853 RepID=UPI001474EC96|nr:ribosome-associated translation inhibitor RaiA [Bacillus fonticola]
MNYNIRGENMELTEALKEYVEKKVGKLERYFNESPDANVHVNLKVRPDKTAKVEITIPLPNLLLRAEEDNADMYAAIDLIIDKLERQIRKHKTRVNRRAREMGSPKEVFAQIVAEEREQRLRVLEEEEEDGSFDIVRTKQFDLKPMDSEEAVLQMNLLGHSFFVFTDAETNRTNVVYKRKDGKYGIIETA